MTPELAYFLKINVGIALFYAFYRLFLYKEPFFIGGGRHYSAFSGFTPLPDAQSARMGESTRAYGSNGRPLCHDTASGNCI